ncbi:MAG: DinB family protein [bacterium]
MKSHQKVMGNPGSAYLTEAIAEEAVAKLETYLEWLDHAVGMLDAETLWSRPSANLNSVGNLLMHLEGNVRQWMLHGLGGEADHRERDLEFTTEGGISGAELLKKLHGTVSAAGAIIRAPRAEEEWLRKREIQGYANTTLSAVIHVVEHFSYHTGQIVQLAKSATGQDMGFYNL